MDAAGDLEQRGAAPAAGPGAVAGWYADPWRQAPLRWWDGMQWTGYLFLTLPPGDQVPKGPGIRGGGFAVAGAVVGIVASTAVQIVELVEHRSATTPSFLLISELPLWACFFAAAALASSRNGSGSLRRDYGLAWPRLPDVRLALLGALAGWAIPLLYATLIAVELHVSHSSRSAPSLLGVSPRGAEGWIVVALVTVVGAPIFEETFFRGLIQGVFNRRCGAVVSLFITAVIFSFSHALGEGPLAPFLIFPGACVLGYLRLRTGRLAAGMVAHATYNSLALLLILIPWFR